MPHAGGLPSCHNVACTVPSARALCPTTIPVLLPRRELQGERLPTDLNTWHEAVLSCRNKGTSSTASFLSRRALLYTTARGAQQEFSCVVLPELTRQNSGTPRSSPIRSPAPSATSATESRCGARREASKTRRDQGRAVVHRSVADRASQTRARWSGAASLKWSGHTVRRQTPRRSAHKIQLGLRRRARALDWADAPA
jgi:hypothetical protein